MWLVCLAALAFGAGATEIVPLGGVWSLTNSNGSLSVPAAVPGEVHTALAAAGVIGAPYDGMNDVAQRWVAEEPHWVYTTNFTVPPAFLDFDATRVVFESLDTVATVTLNGAVVASANNQFVRVVADVNGVLVAGSNVLAVRLNSPVAHAAQLAAQYPYDVPVASFKNGFPSANFIRKRPSDFGWDWGPAYATSGIFGNVTLVGTNTPVIEHVVVHTAAADSTFMTAWVQVHVDVPDGVSAVSARATLSLLNRTVTTPVVKFAGRVKLPPVTLRVPTADVALWWPNGLNTTARQSYALQAILQDEAGGVLDTSAKRVYFRDTQLVQEVPPDKGEGLTFKFFINGVPVYAKGASFVPADAFRSRATPTVYHQLVTSAAEANMNMIRVWGGGSYLPEAFWDACDEAGIMVWLDFMFASALYPRGDAFVDSVVGEVGEVVARISHHASLVTLCGNNEGMIDTNRSTTELSRQLYTADYTVLFDSGVRVAAYDANPFLSFVASSPSNGFLVDQPSTGVIAHRTGWAFSPSYGDVRHYDYSASCTDAATFPKGRFVSEYGWQSLPSLDTWLPVSTPADRVWNSSLMFSRQHHPDGNAQLLAQLQRYFTVPAPSPDNFGTFVYLTQVLQSLCIGTQSQYFRSLQNATGAYTGGSLYWQLNDVWQAPSWSSIEYNRAGARWKLLHSTVQEVFRPAVVTVVRYGNSTVQVTAVNGGTGPMEGTEVRCDALAWATGAAVHSNVLQFGSVAPLGSSPPLTVPASQLLGTAAPTDAVVECTLTTASASPNTTTVWYPSSFVNVALPPAAVQVVSVTQESDLVLSVVLHSTALAPWTFLETPLAGRWTRNGMLLKPGNTTVEFWGWGAVHAEDLQATITTLHASTAG